MMIGRQSLMDPFIRPTTTEEKRQKIAPLGKISSLQKEMVYQVSPLREMMRPQWWKGWFPHGMF